MPPSPYASAGTWAQVVALGRYMAKTEVHTYAFSVAAQVILSLFPFIVLLLTLSEKVFHSEKMADVVGDMMTNFLPNNQDFVMRNMRALAHAHAGTKVFSLVMLLITTTGVFLPLEVALNSVWGVTKNRSYLHNQVVSIGLAVGVGVLAMASVALTAAQQNGDGVDVLRSHGQHRLQVHWQKFSADLCGVGGEHRVVLPHLLGPAESQDSAARRAADGGRDGRAWTAAKYLYILALPQLDFHSVYGPFDVSVSLMMWAFLSGLAVAGGGLCFGYAAGVARGCDLEKVSALYFALNCLMTMSFGWPPAGSMVTSRAVLALRANHGDVAGAGVGDEQQMLVGVEARWRRGRSGADAGDEFAVVDASRGWPSRRRSWRPRAAVVAADDARAKAWSR